ncbi:TPA: oxidoreductase [Candidatus Latescibacteria bacterium]|nr:oxidoreductase [Candidatus Latescibacterota bacterium]
MRDKAQQLERRLSEEAGGEVRFDRLSRILYSTDASMYQIEPVGVFLPRSKDDVISAIRLANEMGVPVIPRGGGTGLAGQTVGKALVVDFSKYLNDIIELNVEERWVRVQPGVVLDELNAYLKHSGLHFAPDVATSSRANVGGMISNNSAGAHSVKYGKTIDHVIELEVVLSDGSVCRWGEMTAEDVREKVEQKNLEGQIFREVVRLSRTHEDEIDRRYPKILRRVGGYNLDAFVSGKPFNMSRMVVGSEGTLAAVTEAKVNLEPLPNAKALGVIQFDDLIESMRAVAPILETQPAAVELIDKMILDQTKGSIELSKQRAWVEGDPDAVLVVEYYADSMDEITPQLDALEELLHEQGLGYGFRRAVSADEQNNVWNVRKAGLGLLMGIIGDAKPVAFVEDSAVSPELLPEYIDAFERIVRSHNTVAGYYAHASVGLLHIRPVVNLKSPDGVAQMRSIAEQVRELVLKYGGSMSGEHGDGLVRSCWNEQMFGTQLYKAFREVKRAFDPGALLNPGKIVDAPMMTEHLRIGPHYQADEPQTHFDFSSQGGFARAIEMCNGVGQCRKKLVGTMCPSYMATLDEADTTRGRANALRAAISGDLDDGLSDQAVYDALDLCLECKACKSECPSNVDMAKLKYEFIAQYYEKHGRPFRAWLFGNIEMINKVGCLVAPIANWAGRMGPAKALMEKIGIAPERTLPPFASRTFERWFNRRKGAASDKKVVMFADTYCNYNYPNIGESATEILEAAGFEVVLADKKCCGRPMLTGGMMTEVKRNAVYNVERLYEYVKEGYEVVGFEPSCVSMLTDDYNELIPGEETRAVADSAYTFESFLSKLNRSGELGLQFLDTEKSILVHGHCHQKALWGIGPSLDVLNLPPGYSASVIDSACCGMAGAFGFEKEHYDVSLKIGEQRLLSVVREAGADVEIVAAGLSCREQIQQTTGREARHPAEVLREALA